MMLPFYEKHATLSPCGQYRYTLIRQWGDGPRCCFIMLNPSTADAQEDDPTIRRCLGFARHWRFGSLIVVNLFAYRATDRNALARVPDPVGPDNDRHIQRAAVGSGRVVCAWGTWGSLFDRQRIVAEALAWGPLHCLRTTGGGFPQHPLYCLSDTRPVLWQPASVQETA